MTCDTVFFLQIFICDLIFLENRNNCRACRFRKCLEGGLNPKRKLFSRFLNIFYAFIIFSKNFLFLVVHSDRKVPPNHHQSKPPVYKEEPSMTGYMDNISISPYTRLTVLDDGSSQNSVEISDYSPYYENKEDDPELWEVRHILANGEHLVRTGWGKITRLLAPLGDCS